jgi:hypothetical protein
MFSVFFPHVTTSTSSSSYNIISTGMILFIILTVAACIYWGIKAITGSKVKYPHIHIILLIIWFLTIPVMTATFIREAGNYIGYNKSTKTFNINACDTIYLNMNPSEVAIPDNLSGAYYDGESKCYYGKPDMYIRKSDDKSKLKITKTSRGRNNREAFEYVGDIVYDFDVENSQITVSPYFTVDQINKWKNQRLEIVLYVPENTVVIVDESLCYTNIIVKPRLSEHDGNTCKWIMTHEGIKALD